jgi:hypothetical protein
MIGTGPQIGTIAVTASTNPVALEIARLRLVLAYMDSSPLWRWAMSDTVWREKESPKALVLQKAGCGRPVPLTSKSGDGERTASALICEADPLFQAAGFALRPPFSGSVISFFRVAHPRGPGRRGRPCQLLIVDQRVSNSPPTPVKVKRSSNCRRTARGRLSSAKA